jgi:zinc/manganese transport system permease protein
VISFVALPLVAAMVLVGIHGYFGGIVLRRGIIFIDLALAQWAALGVLIGHWLGVHSEWLLFGMGFSGTVLAAGILTGLDATTKLKHGQEATIGVMYVLAMTMAMVIMSSTGIEGHHLTHMLSGHLLFVTPKEVAFAAVLYALIGGIAWRFHHQWALATSSKPWNFLFYALFGLVVTSSVKMVGILLVFSLLVLPVLTAMLWVPTFKGQCFLGWALGVMGAILGLTMAMAFDIPLSLCIICATMAIFFASAVVKTVRY